MKRVIVALTAMMVITTGMQVNAQYTEINSLQEFDSIAQQNPVVIVMAGSHACPHCRKMLPIFNQLSMEMGNAKFVFVDAMNPSFTDRFGVRNMPTFKIVKNGQIVGGTAGEQSIHQLRSALNK